MSEAEMRRLRGRELALIPKSPSTSLNPVLTAGVQIAEALRLHQGLVDVADTPERYLLTAWKP